MSQLIESSPSTIRTYLIYLVLLSVFGAGLWLILASGSRIGSDGIARGIASQVWTVSPSVEQSQPATRSSYARRILWENLRSPLSILFLQIVVIIAATRLFRRLFQKIGQPPVMGEMVAGIFLGPSVLGLLSPETMVFLFPASSMVTLRLLSQIGVVLFMFVVGMELNVQHLREKGPAAIMISLTWHLDEYSWPNRIGCVKYRL